MKPLMLVTISLRMRREEGNKRFLSEKINQLEQTIESFISDDMPSLYTKVRKIAKKFVDDEKAEVDEIVKAKKDLINSSNTVSSNANDLKCSNNRLPRSCHEINICDSHIYNIQLPEFSKEPFPAVCDLKTDNGGWTIIQRRRDGSENFFRSWNEYVAGFGNVNGEFFIGLEKLHALTALGEPQELYIILQDFEGERKYARYGHFKVDSEKADYKLSVGNYSGNVSDCFSPHNGKKFSTKDHDNDESAKHCAAKYKGGWWYSDCYYSNLNGLYLAGKAPTKDGISWCTFRGYDYSLKFVQMMIRPKVD